MHFVSDVDLGSFEPFVRANTPPNTNEEHWPAVDKAGPVHQGRPRWNVVSEQVGAIARQGG